MSDWKGLAARDLVPILGKRIEQREILARVYIRPPHFTLDDFVWDGVMLKTATSAETPAFRERGPMSAAELGRHAAITGICRTALAQRDGAQCCHLLRRAFCRYEPSHLPFGSLVAFEAELLALEGSYAQTRVRAYAAQRLASFDISYAVLDEAAFGRLAGQQGQKPDRASNSYASPIDAAVRRGEGWAEQRFTVLPKLAPVTRAIIPPCRPPP